MGIFILVRQHVYNESSHHLGSRYYKFLTFPCSLTHWDMITSVVYVFIGSANGLVSAWQLNQYRLVFNWTIRNKPEWDLNQNTSIFFHKLRLKMSFSKWWSSCLGLKVLVDRISTLAGKCMWLLFTQLHWTHWGRVTHIYVGELTIIVSDNCLSPGRRQAIIWTNTGILLIGPYGTNFSEILIEILTFSFTQMSLKVSSAKWRPFCLGLNVLRNTQMSQRSNPCLWCKIINTNRFVIYCFN